MIARLQILRTLAALAFADSAPRIGIPPKNLAKSVGIRLACSWGMTPQELRERTSDFAKRVVHLTGPLLAHPDASNIARQLRKAAMSVSANCRAAGRARSHREFTAKIGVVREEVDESLHRLALMRECSLDVGEELDALASEAEELVKIFARAFATARKREREKNGTVASSSDEAAR